MPDKAIPVNQAIEKVCHKCFTLKPMDDFYAHPNASDGRDNSCKECRKALVTANRLAKAGYYQAYDRKRYRDEPKRKVAARKSSESPAGVASRARSQQNAKADCPEKKTARAAVRRAVMSGKMERQPCYFCGRGDKTQAHHEDYAHPLDVFWLCPSCRGKLHTIKGDMRRSKA
jgi:hypothetical protein